MGHLWGETAGELSHPSLNSALLTPFKVIRARRVPGTDSAISTGKIAMPLLLPKTGREVIELVLKAITECGNCRLRE